ncbi:MAG: hypothetical protein L6R36_009231, partial [Xanthoria steineri]
TKDAARHCLTSFIPHKPQTPSAIGSSQHRLAQSMSNPTHVPEMVLAIFLAVILLNYTPSNSTDTVPITFDYVRYTGLDLTKYVDPSLVTSCLFVGSLVFLTVIIKMLEQLTKMLEQLTQKLEKRIEKDLGDKKIGCDHLLPLYHTAGTMENASAVRMRSTYGSGEDTLPCHVTTVIRSIPSKTITLPSTTFTTRVLIWLRVITLLVRVIILQDIFRTLKKDTCLGIIVGCLASLSLGVWVFREPSTNNAVANNGSNKSKRLTTCLVHATGLAILIDEYVQFIAQIHDRDLVDLLHTMTVLVAGLPSFDYILTELDLVSSIDRVRHKTEEMEKSWEETAPLLSSADGAVFKDPPNTADDVTFLADVSLGYMMFTLILDFVLVVLGDPKVHTIRNINRTLFLESFFLCGATSALTSRFFKYCLDGFLQMVKGGKKITAASINTKDGGKTGPSATRLIARNEDDDHHQVEDSAWDLGRDEEIVGCDHGDRLSEDDFWFSDSEILEESAGYHGQEGDDRQNSGKTWIVV